MKLSVVCKPYSCPTKRVLPRLPTGPTITVRSLGSRRACAVECECMKNAYPFCLMYCTIFDACIMIIHTEDIPLADGTRTSDFKGSVFLLPTVSEEEAKTRYPGYHTCDVPSGINYLRLVKKEEVN